MNDLTNAEREFHINVTGDNRSVAEVYTDDPVWINRLDRWFTPCRTSITGRWYRIPTNKIVRVSLLMGGDKSLRGDTNDQDGAVMPLNLRESEAGDAETGDLVLSSMN